MINEPTWGCATRMENPNPEHRYDMKSFKDVLVQSPRLTSTQVSWSGVWFSPQVMSRSLQSRQRWRKHHFITISCLWVLCPPHPQQNTRLFYLTSVIPRWRLLPDLWPPRSAHLSRPGFSCNGGQPCKKCARARDGKYRLPVGRADRSGWAR